MGARTAIHTVVVCRSFDWKHDPRLRRLLSKDHDQIEVTEFQRDEVEIILAREAFNLTLFQARQLELLRLPQNLSLFIEAGLDPSREPDFNTATRLFDHYWNKKRASVDIGTTDEWMPVIETLCDEMSVTQQLSVPQERLDHIQPEYLRRLASEGVLTFERRHYGFGHESFFDYCFARVFMNRAASIATLLKSSEQHLFRRAQVRQVLAYLREADTQRYRQELEGLLSDQSIRAHVKDLAFALLAEVTDPSPEEWAIWDRWIAAALQGIESGVQCTEKLSILAWRRFFGSTSWFSYADRHGMIRHWLASGNDRVVDMAVDYLWAHHSHDPDQVACLLAPYVNRGDKWVARLRSLMEKTQHHTSRPYFDLLLRLVDSGSLDDNHKPTRNGRSFWLMLYTVGESRPEWVPEAVAHHLRRRHATIDWADQRLRRRDLIGYDKTAEKLIRNASERAPTEFVMHLLPVVLDISDATQLEDHLPKRDAVWSFLSKSEPFTGEQVCLIGLASALQALTREDSELVLEAIPKLRSRDSYVANFLLQSAYSGNPKRFAQEAISLLCSQNWRFRCGFSDSPHWCTVELIRSVIPHCSTALREMLETAIVGFVGPFERPTAQSRFNEIGRSSFSLLAAIPEKTRSTQANQYFHELERRFGVPEDEPKIVTSGIVRSPIEESVARKMTDDQWRRAIVKYPTERGQFPRGDFLKGGAYQLSEVLEVQAKEDPQRFALLALTFPDDANPLYITRTLDALKDAVVENELKLQVCSKAYAESRGQAGKSIADVLGSIEDLLEKDAVEILCSLAVDHEDPQKDLWQVSTRSGQPYYNGDIYTNGINTTRGRAAEAIQRLILTDAAYVDRFRPAIDQMIIDGSTAVRSCVAAVLRAIAYHDPELGLSLFLRMDLSEDRLLATPHVQRLIRDHLRAGLPKLHQIIIRMLHSADTDVCQTGGRLASIAAMVHSSARELGDEAMQGTRKQRVGAAVVAARNIGVPQFRAWCETRLLTHFNDADHDVRQQASFCFAHIPADSIESYADLVAAFCDSKAFAAGAFSLIEALDQSHGRLPGMTCMVCERALDHPSHDTFAVAKLIFRTYQQHQNDEWTSRALDFIDRLCLDGYPGVGSEFEEFDR